MSRGYCWLAALVMCGTFFVGMVTIAAWSPAAGIAVGAVMVGALIGIAQEAAQL